MTGWAHAAEVIEARYEALGMLKVDFYRASGLSETTFRKMAKGVAVGRPANRRAIERALLWTAGSLDAVVAGGIPIPIEARDMAVEVTLEGDHRRIVQLQREVSQLRDELRDLAAEVRRLVLLLDADDELAGAATPDGQAADASPR